MNNIPSRAADSSLFAALLIAYIPIRSKGYARSSRLANRATRLPFVWMLFMDETSVGLHFEEGFVVGGGHEG